jgi:UDP-N-acetyl-D-mannosaminuronic acid dehydrogenase
MVDIAIIGGCGHVGLPLGLALARAGKRVVAIDVDAKRVRETNGGTMPFRDRGADDLLPRVLKAGTFTCTTEPAVVSQADTVISVVGTPIDEYLNPRFEIVQDFVAQYEAYLRTGQLLVLRSTLYPGSTTRVERLLHDKGLTLEVAFCPERVAEGAALEEITTLPQVVAGCTAHAQERAEALFRLLTPVVIPMAPLGAELTKLFNNVWRYIQFAVANQFFMIANDYGMNFYDIHHAMTEQYPRAQNFPRAGFAAGPCLFKDTMQLSAFHNNSFFLGHAAMLINEGMPAYVVEHAARRFPLSEMTVGILGMTFKADSDDPRDSLSFKLRKILQTQCRKVLCTDPYLTDPTFTPLQETLVKADLLFIGAPHSVYRTLDFGDTPVIDIWNVIRRQEVSQ